MLKTVGLAMDAVRVPATHDDAPDAFLAALETAAQTADPDAAAAAAETITESLAPLLTRVASAYAASWPTPVDAAELLHEAVAAVLAGLSHAPRASRAVAVSWFSAEVFRALHAARDVAAGGASASRTVVTEAPKDQRLRLILSALAPHEADALRLRSAGASWTDIARQLRVSPAAARRLHDQALAKARELAAPLRHVA